MKKLNLLVVLCAMMAIVFAACSDDESDDTSTSCDGVTCPLPDQSCVGGACVYNSDVVVLSGFITGTLELDANNIYVLRGKVVVNDGATLNIAAGTIMKAEEGSGAEAVALLVERGGTINVNGTAANPVIMTSVLDNIVQGEKVGTTLEGDDTGKWGGLIVLGKAPISAETGAEAKIEGIPPSDNFGFYGGNIEDDNSGTIRYLSIRHGGAKLGDGDEINGLTLGGVGDGTTIDHVEVVSNDDDGIELFGGTVDIEDAIVVYQSDDAFDVDMSWDGFLENIMVIQGGPADSDNALEIDGPEAAVNDDGFFDIEKGTFITIGGVGRGATLKSGAQGDLYNNLWIGFNELSRVRANFNMDCSDKDDALTNLLPPNPFLAIYDNEFESATLMGNDIVTVYTENDFGCTIDPATEAAVDAAATGMKPGADNTGDNKIVAEGAGSIGADRSVFKGWTWADAKGLVD